MSILLKFLIVYIFFTFFLVGIIFSKIKIKFQNVHIDGDIKNIQSTYLIKFEIYFYGILKIFSLKLNENEVRFLFFKISYKKILNSKFYAKLKNIDIKEIENRISITDLKNIKFDLENLDMNLYFGVESVLLTSFSIFVISTLIGILVKKTVKKYDEKKYKYMIAPKYKNNYISLSLNCIFSMKMVHIIFILLNYKRRSVKKYERTSYRRSYENSYE